MSKTYVVTFGYDMGGPESGPMIQTGQEFVEANSKKEAEQIIIDTYSDSDPSGYGGFEGCWAREATEKDVAEMIEALKMEPPYEPDIEYDMEYWEDQGYTPDPRIWTGLESVPEQWKYLLNEDVKSATSVESGSGLWVLEEIKQVKDSDGFYTDYTLWSNVNTGEWCCVFGDSDVYTPEEGWTDAEFDTEEEARQWFDNYTGFDEDDIESATDVSRPNVDGDNLYGGQVDPEKYDLYTLRDNLAELRDETTGLRDKYWQSGSRSVLNMVYEGLADIINTIDNYMKP